MDEWSSEARMNRWLMAEPDPFAAPALGDEVRSLPGASGA
jgi:hypothetical protein